MKHVARKYVDRVGNPSRRRILIRSHEKATAIRREIRRKLKADGTTKHKLYERTVIEDGECHPVFLEAVHRLPSSVLSALAHTLRQTHGIAVVNCILSDYLIMRAYNADRSSFDLGNLSEDFDD
tara:strand:+ start:50 stop:421 length:372 start_codon:yes stop_codon:yes gene_type:complete